jgi:hypothetical protein
MMTDQDTELAATMRRLRGFLGDCPMRSEGEGHTWNLDTGRCELCGQQSPYREGDHVDGDGDDTEGRASPR